MVQSSEALLLGGYLRTLSVRRIRVFIWRVDMDTGEGYLRTLTVISRCAYVAVDGRLGGQLADCVDLIYVGCYLRTLALRVVVAARWQQ